MRSIWFAKAIGGIITLAIFLAVTPEVVKSTISGSSTSLNQGAAETLQRDINNVCNGETDSVGGTVNLNSETSIELEGNKMYIEGGSDSDQESSYTLECEIESSETFEQSQPYEVVRTDNGGYKIT